MRSTGSQGCSTTGSDGLVSLPFASPPHFLSRNRPALLRTGLSSPVDQTESDSIRTMRTLALTLAIVAVVPFVTIRQTAQALGLLNPATTTTTAR